ncbi:MAG TPA: hypothetical protein VFK07_01630 [Candidatus Paceibacterota bacterium]|nr:hypothetical protein [Candidatus Paceibacterota bacterium]
MKWAIGTIYGMVVCAVIGIGFIVVNFDPTTATYWIRILFLALLFLGAAGLLSATWYAFLVLKHEPAGSRLKHYFKTEDEYFTLALRGGAVISLALTLWIVIEHLI